MFTRQDVNYALLHILLFLIGYSSSMAQKSQKDLFNWDAFNSGLIVAGGGAIGISIVGKSVTKDQEEKELIKANLTRDILASIKKEEPKEKQ